MKKLCLVFLLSVFAAISVAAASVERSGRFVYVYPDAGEAQVLRLQVVSDRIIRVQATSSASLPDKPKSLIIVPEVISGQGIADPTFAVSEKDSQVIVTTASMQAVVSKRDGRVTFCDNTGKVVLKEAQRGKRFWPYRVPAREIGVDSALVSEDSRHGLSWQMVFDHPGEALYGLGQHQSEEMNLLGKNEELFQYNTKVSVPFVVSNRNYGLLWDSYSYCRFGQPTDYLQLHQAFRLYDKNGCEGHLTATYTDKDRQTVVRDEDSIYYEYDLPASSELCRRNDCGGIQNLPKGFKLKGSTVVYEGFIQPLAAEEQSAPSDQYSPLREFILYYAGYVKVYIGGELVVPERWRTAWNPNTYKFAASLPTGQQTSLRIEWQPDGDVSYLGLRVAQPRSICQREQLSVWSEMAQDMDYYFIYGQSLDDVIGGYRTLTGRAPVYPKWVLGYWQSRERYKTQDELLTTLREFRRRHLPIDNIVQDWNYWPEDEWGSHLFEYSRYPDPEAMLDSVHSLNGRFMLSVWPKFYVSTANYQELDNRGLMYHQAVADDLHDWVGRGYVGSFYDAYSDEGRQLFWQQLAKLSVSVPDSSASLSLASKQQPAGSRFPLASKIDAWWMDASEPNVRDCTPMWYRKALCGPTALGTATEYFNAYSLVNAQAIYEGQRGLYASGSGGNRVEGEPRVFLLTRSGFAGLQRYSTATWSGDIATRWEDMRAQMTAGMNYSLSGLPFWGMDQGGFCVENRYVKAMQANRSVRQPSDDESEDLKEWRELQTRWHQFGAFIPIFRSHGQWPLREPWHIAPDHHPAYQSFVYYDRLRYHLMPYLYSMAGWVHLKDYTMMRHLVMDYGHDHKVLDIKDQWMFGPSLMACPVSDYKARSRSVYFPEGSKWYDLYSGRMVTDEARRIDVSAPYDRIPVFVPSGGIIPFGPDIEFIDEKPDSIINLYVYAGADGKFTLYEDEGTNYNYEQGHYSTTDITYDDSSRTLSFGKRKGSFEGMLQKRIYNIIYVCSDNPRPLQLDNPQGRRVTYKGRKLKVKLKSHIRGKEKEIEKLLNK